jgi:hypothetical protein
MSIHNVIFFPDELQEHGTEVKSKLKEKYSCFQSTNLDEFDQVFKQSGKFLLLFMDVKKALQFVQDHSNELTGLQYQTFVYLNRNGKFKADSQKILDAGRVQAFQKDDAAVLLKTIDDFFSKGGPGGDALNVDDITFIMPEDE